MTLGICDWGIGGLGLYGILKRSRPDIGITYVGDQGSMPYSLLSRPELADRVQEMLHTFQRLGVDRVVFASDAASTALGEVTADGITATGVIEPTLRSMRGKRFREVGVIGGRRTILSGAYGRALRKQRFCVLQRVSLDLSQEIENGHAASLHTREIIQGLLEPLVKVDCLLLACTHYRVVIPTLQEFLPNAEIVDSVEKTAAELLQTLPEADGKFSPDTFFTTGDPQSMRKNAAEVFGIQLKVEPLTAARPGLAA